MPWRPLECIAEKRLKKVELTEESESKAEDQQRQNQPKMAELSPSDRLVRKRNSNLQKQLHVTLQILSEEYRQTKERMYKEERDCGKFLQSLYNTVPGLHTYGQPDTRAMNTNSMLKERRFSVSVSVVSDTDDSEHNSPFPHQNRRPWTSRPDRPGGRKNSDHAGKRGGRVNSARETSTERSLQSKLRPSTAGPWRTDGTHGTARQADTHRPPSPSSSQPTPPNPKYGKGAYTEHDRYTQDKVLKKFQVIFDPDTETKKVNLSTMSTPIVVVDADNDCANNISTASMSHHQSHVIHVNGKEFRLNRMPPRHRRVVWSAHAHRQPGIVSSPNSARSDQEAPDSARLKSSTVTSMKGRPKSAAVTMNCSSQSPSSHASIDNKIQSLALQRSPRSCFVAEEENNSQCDKKTKKTAMSGHAECTQNNPKNKNLDPSQQLQVPGNNHHPSPTQKQCRQTADAQGKVHKTGVRRPSSRMSEASVDRSAPVELWSRLMKAGLKNARENKRRSLTAPSKSELSHRSMPAPRQTVVGILAQIENQKANTRALLNTSKQLQKSIKKLVPRTQSVESLDDW